MTTGDPEPQTERIRQLFVTGDLEHLKSVMDIEVSLWRDRAFRDLRHSCLPLVGPVVHGASIMWFLPSGSQADLLLFHDCTDEMMTLRWRLQGISVSPGMTLQQIWDQAFAEHVNLSYALHLGLLRAIQLPQSRLRLLFAVAGFVLPPLFWRWVDDLAAELDQMGFHPAAPPGEPSLGTAPAGQGAAPAALGLPPKPEEPQPGAGLDLWFDWQAECDVRSYKVTLREIAAKARYAYDTVKKKHALYMAERRP
jgi:hypothetical protein